MLRWAFYVLLAPVVLVLGAAQAFQAHPVVDTTHDVTIQVAGAPTLIPRAAAVPVPTLVADMGDASRLQRLVEAARTWLGTPYQWGGCTPRGIDCSCFVQHVYATLGVNVPRTTVTQVAVETVISRDQLRVGDSIFYDNTCTGCGPNPTHVGMYIGNGLQIDAGDPIQIEPVFWNKLHSIGRPVGL